MRRTILIPGIIGGLLGLVTSSHLAYATGYGFGTLDVPGGNNTAAFGINDAGQVVGSFASSTGVHGFLYSGGTFTQIDVPSGTYTEAFGINNAGQIVGWYQIDGFAQLGFADTSGSFSTIQVGPTYTQAYGVNDHAEIVGLWNDILGQHGFLDESGIITTFDVRTAPTASGFTKAYGINNLGQIVGTFFIEGDGAHGFVYSGGTFTQIDFPGDYGATQVFGINDLGWIVGIGSSGTFVDIAGSFVPLNIPNGGTSYGNPLPRGINRLGQVVGSFKDNVEGLQHGFVTTPIFAGTRSQASCHGQSVPRWSASLVG